MGIEIVSAVVLKTYVFWYYAVENLLSTDYTVLYPRRHRFLF
jgi:hypothetical protein